MPNESGKIPAYDVVMASFEGIDTASHVLNQIKAEEKLEGCEIEGAALISRDAEGNVHFHERGAAGIGATFGAATAGMIGLVGGPLFLLLMLVFGGVAGGVVGHFAGQVLPPEDLKRVGETLRPGSSAYLMVVDAEHADGVAAAFEEHGATVLNIPVHTELSSVIREAITHRIMRV